MPTKTGLALVDHFRGSWWIYVLGLLASLSIGWPALVGTKSVVLALGALVASTVWISSLVHTSKISPPYHIAWAIVGIVLSFLSPLLFVVCTHDGSSDFPMWWIVMGFVFSVIFGVILVKRRKPSADAA